MIDCADVAAGQALLPHVPGPRTTGGMVGAGRPSGVALRHLHRLPPPHVPLIRGMVEQHERDAGAAKQHSADI